MSIRNADRANTEVLELLHTRSIEGWDTPSFLLEMAECLSSLGMSLYRVQFGHPILHPLFAVSAYTWYPGKGVETDTYARGFEEEEAFRSSPVYPIFASGASEGRHKILAGSDSDKYPMFVRAAGEGATDYFVQLTGYANRTVSPLSLIHI